MAVMDVDVHSNVGDMLGLETKLFTVIRCCIEVQPVSVKSVILLRGTVAAC